MDRSQSDIDALVAAMVVRRRSRRSVQGDDEAPRKRRHIKRDFLRARTAVHDDYWGSPTPLFDDKQFVRVFRISRRAADDLLDIAGNADSFFTEQTDGVTGESTICPKVKLLVGPSHRMISISGTQALFLTLSSLERGQMRLILPSPLPATSSLNCGYSLMVFTLS